MSRKPGSKNKPKKEDTIHSHNVTTQTELGLLESICSNLEKMGEDQRQRAGFFLMHKYPEYFPLTNKK